MKLILLISCMHEKDHSIIERSNVQTDVVVVNQCDKDSVDEFDFKNKKGETCHAKFINTTERGLSRSRNMAIRNAWGNVCLIADDDETFEDDIEETIIKNFHDHPKASLIAFSLRWVDVNVSYPSKPMILRFKNLLQVSSVQICFKLMDVINNNILFDEKMGSGTGNGGGEENHFMLDCRKAGFEMWYCPSIIATISKGESKWFKGYTEKYFRDRGWTSRRNLGPFTGFAFIMYNALNHRKSFTSDGLSFFGVLKNMIKGFFESR